MIPAALAHWHTTMAACRDRAARELSKWSRATLAVTIGFGTFLMLLGSLFTYGLAIIGYGQLERGGLFGFGSDPHYWETIGFWMFVLLLLYGGESIRGAGWRELRRRRSGTAVKSANSTTASTGSVIIGVLLAPVLLFWGALGVVSFVRTWQFFMSRPAWNRPSLRMILTSGGLWEISVWWLLTLTWLAGGVVLIWRGIHVLSRRSASGS